MQQDTKRGIFSNQQKPIIWLILAMFAGLLAHAPSLGNDWINWDDNTYVLENRMVQELTVAHVKTMFQPKQYVGLYHPLTLLSFGVDHQIWGKDAFGYHLTNLLLHLLNICLVFLLILKLSKEHTIALITALLFAMHPMYVEAVGWISGRKELLYTAFLLLGLLSYIRYRRVAGKSKTGRYLLIVLLFICSILSNGTAVVFPFILFLIDYLEGRKWNWKEQLIEKTPFLLLTIAGLYLVFQGQEQSGSLMPELTSFQSVFVASRNLLVYFFSGIFPWKLSGFHPYPTWAAGSIPTSYYLSMVIVLGGAYLTYRAFTRSKPVFWGISLFVLCLVPVLQLIPFEKAIIAERYSYLAYLGLFYVIGWTAFQVWNSQVPRLQKIKTPLLVIGIAWLLILGVTTFSYSKKWQDGGTFWSHVIQQYPNHYYAYLSRAKYHIEQNDPQAAMLDVNQGISLQTREWEGWYLRGILLERQQAYKEAIQSYTSAIQRKGNVSAPYLNRGKIKGGVFRNIAAAQADFDTAIYIKPDYALAYFNRGVVSKIAGNYPQALSDYNRAISLEPWNPPFYRNRAMLYYAMEMPDSSLKDLSRAIELKPNFAEAWFMRSEVYKALENWSAARENAHQAAALGFPLPSGYLESLQ